MGKFGHFTKVTAVKAGSPHSWFTAQYFPLAYCKCQCKICRYSLQFLNNFRIMEIHLLHTYSNWSPHQSHNEIDKALSHQSNILDIDTLVIFFYIYQIPNTFTHTKYMQWVDKLHRDVMEIWQTDRTDKLCTCKCKKIWFHFDSIQDHSMHAAMTENDTDCFLISSSLQFDIREKEGW